MALVVTLLVGVAAFGTFVNDDCNAGWLLMIAVLCFGASITRHDADH